MTRDKFVYIPGELEATAAYGSLGLLTLLRDHPEPRHAFHDLLRAASYVYERPDLDALFSNSPDAKRVIPPFPPYIAERAAKFAKEFLAPTDEALVVVGHVLTLFLEGTDIAATLDYLRTASEPEAVVYRALSYGESPTTQTARDFVSEQRALLAGVPRYRINKILRDAVVWADVHEVYGDSLGDALVGKYRGRSRTWLSRATAPVYRALGVRLARGPRAGELPTSVLAQRAGTPNLAS